MIPRTASSGCRSAHYVHAREALQEVQCIDEHHQWEDRSCQNTVDRGWEG